MASLSLFKCTKWNTHIHVRGTSTAAILAMQAAARKLRHKIPDSTDAVLD